jgi:hypothetical protein
MRYSYTKDGTALLFVDPYNDFLWPYVREVAEEVGLLDNLRAIHSRDPQGWYPHLHRAASPRAVQGFRGLEASDPVRSTC